jgi:catechol 2,3-dioxygenase-like lactoylglutathione lyase family enzyme
MSLTFDHAVIAVPDLEVAVRDYQSLGFTVVTGGVHANRATHNALIVFRDATYLELLAPTGQEPVPQLLDFTPMLLGCGITGFALRSDDLEAEAVRLRGAGFPMGGISAGARRHPDGTLIEWKLALLNESFAPFLIQDVTPRERRVPGDSAAVTHPNGAHGVPGIVIATRDMARARDYYARLMGRSPDDRAHGITLRAVESVSGESTSEVALDAILLRCEDSSHPAFDLERTHGVRFERMST